MKTLGLFAILAALLLACAETKPPENSSLKNRLVWHGNYFAEDADVDVQIDNSVNPPSYVITISHFPDKSSAKWDRISFFNDISRHLIAVAEDTVLNKLKGTHRFHLRAETIDKRGFVDTSRTVYVRLPNNLDVNWKSMYGDAPSFLEFLNYAERRNPDVFINWILPEMKPDNWR